MMKSVWLSSLIVTSLNDPTTVLSSYFSHLCSLTGSDVCMMLLAEPDDGEKTYFRLSHGSACITPSPSINIENETIAKVMKSKTPLYSDRLLFCPLYFENISSFGVLVFDSVSEQPDTEKLKSALIAFSSILYSESMGSIIKSFHNTVMRVENVCVDYHSGKITNRAVKNASLEICSKEFTVIAGSSGSGKSSLLNVLGGMLTATEGKVWWKETEVTGMNEKERTAYRANTIGFVFQRYNLISDLTAEENIKVAASLVSNPLPASEVLEMVGLKSKAKSYPSQLSGGEQQRVCIARALVKRAELLLCDEPTGALDTANALQVITILQNIAKEQGIPVVVITHNPNLVVLADHCITISNGTIADDRLQPFALSAADLKQNTL